VRLIAHLRWGMLTVLLWRGCTYAGDKKDNPKPPAVQMVDSGSFGVFVRGQRVVTESFSVQQDNGVSNSQIPPAGNCQFDGPGQKSDLQMTGSGELVRYDWSDGNSSLVVTPKNEFLLERITTGSSSKPAEQPFLMPNTSAISR